jgi:hypothetical protein
MSDEWLLYIVANTLSPYGDELPAILAYPNGFCYRARFEDKWLDRQLLGNLHELRGIRCLIVYRDFETGDLYPIRFGEVREISTYGDVVYIQYELRQIVPYPRTLESRKQQLEEFRRGWAADHPDVARANLPRKDMSPLVFRSKYVPRISNPYLPPGDEDSQEFESWSNVCKHLSTISAYTGTEFLRVLRMRASESASSVVPIKGIYHLKPVKGIYHLKPRRSYELLVAQRFFQPPADIHPHKVDFRCSGGGFRALTNVRRAVGKYDVLPFHFQTEPTGPRSASGVLSITRESPNGSPLELELPAQVQFELPVVGLLFAGIGVLALVFPEFVTHFGIPKEYETLISRLGTLLYVIGLLKSKSIFDYARTP